MHNRLKFELEVIIYRRPNLRDDALEFEMFMGQGVLRKLFDSMEMMPELEHLFLSFPERWLNIIEQRQIFDRLAMYCPNLKTVKIKTHSVYIIQCTPNTCAKLIRDEDAVVSASQSDLTTRLYAENKGNLFNLNGLNIVTGEGVLQIPTKPNNLK